MKQSLLFGPITVYLICITLESDPAHLPLIAFIYVVVGFSFPHSTEHAVCSHTQPVYLEAETYAVLSEELYVVHCWNSGTVSPVWTACV